MTITREAVAQQLTDSLQHRMTRTELVDSYQLVVSDLDSALRAFRSVGGR